MKILCKFPTRSRPEQFKRSIKLAYDLANNKKDILFFITTDSDDDSMDIFPSSGNFWRLERLKNIPLIHYGGVSENKVHACNRNMDIISGHAFDWDILVLLSDDMICQREGWDDIIRDNFKENELSYHHYSDGYNYKEGNDIVCTMPIMTREYYNRFGYIYNPEYKSLFCDTEQTIVAKQLNEYQYFDKVLFKHEHYMNNKSLKPDELMKKNQSFYLQDKATFEMRKKNNFRFTKTSEHTLTIKQPNT